MGETILVADDEARIIRLMRSWLRRAGYKVTATTRSEEVLTCVRDAWVDLIILDVHWPSSYLMGCEIAGAIRRDPTMSGVPIILLSVVTADAPANPADFLGPGRVRCCIDPPVDAVHYLFKPFGREHLLPLAEELLRG